MAQSQGWTVNLHDDDGDILETRVYSAADSSKLASSVHYIYARGGSLAASVRYDYRSEDGVVEYHTNSYFTSGRLVRRSIFSSDEVLVYEEQFRYDRHGRLVRRKAVAYDGAYQTRTLEKRTYTGSRCHAKVFHDGQLIYDNSFETTTDETQQ